MTPLSARLRTHTTDAHRRAERARFVRELLDHTLPRAAYERLLVSYWHVYAALERAIDAHAGHVVVGAIRFPALHRRGTIEDDLAYFLGDEWRTRLDPSPAARRYVHVLERLAETFPAGLVAHAYTRYLGDLSGGQLLKRHVAASLGIPDGEGVAFYEFGGIADPTAFKQTFRARLDALPLDEAATVAVLDEAIRAFELTAALLEEVVPGTPTLAASA